MLKQYISRPKAEGVGGVLLAEVDEIHVEGQFPTCIDLVNIGCQLSEEQRAETLALLEESPDVFRDLPEKYNLVKCEINLKDDSPCSVQNSVCIAIGSGKSNNPDAFHGSYKRERD